MDAEGSGAVGAGSAWSPLPYPGWLLHLPIYISGGGHPKFCTVTVTREQWPPPCCGHPQLMWAQPYWRQGRPPRWSVTPVDSLPHRPWGPSAPLHPSQCPRPQTGPHTSGPSSSPQLPRACCWAPACPPTAGGPAHLQRRTRAILGGRLKRPTWFQKEQGRWPQPRVS